MERKTKQVLRFIVILLPAAAAFLVMYLGTYPIRRYDQAWLNYLGEIQKPIVLNMLVTSMIILVLINLFGSKFEKITASMMPIAISIIYAQSSQDLSVGLAVVMAMTMVAPLVAIVALSKDEIREIEAEDSVTSTTGSGTGY